MGKSKLAREIERRERVLRYNRIRNIEYLSAREIWYSNNPRPRVQCAVPEEYRVLCSYRDDCDPVCQFAINRAEIAEYIKTAYAAGKSAYEEAYSLTDEQCDALEYE